MPSDRYNKYLRRLFFEGIEESINTAPLFSTKYWGPILDIYLRISLIFYINEIAHNIKVSHTQ